MQEINVKLDVFEGPLDLLLHLIKKMEIDIYDIPIATVTAQYMTYIHTMQTLELEIAGEYLVMAASLMAIKSKMLLPKQELLLEDVEEDPTGEDPRDALVAQLLEYRKYKYAANLLQEKEAERSLYYTKEATDLEEYKETKLKLEPNQLNTIDLFLAFHTMLQKKKERKPLETTIEADDVSIEEKITTISEKINQLNAQESISFDYFFHSYSKQELVTTFMALLELIKKGQVLVKQEENYSDIFLFKAQKEVQETNLSEETT